MKPAFGTICKITTKFRNYLLTSPCRGNNIIAYDYYGKEIWKINDIVQAKIPRGYDEIEKKLDSILIAHYELGIIFEIDVYKRQIIQKKYLR